jgi:hypothetical protein
MPVRSGCDRIWAPAPAAPKNCDWAPARKAAFVRDQTILRLGGVPSATRHRLHADRGIAAAGKFLARGLNLTFFIVGDGPVGGPGALVLAISISAMLLYDACHSIDSPNVGPICSTRSELTQQSPESW